MNLKERQAIRERVEGVQGGSRGWIKGEKQYYSKDAAQLIDTDIPDLLDELEEAIGLLEKYHEHVCSAAPLSWAAKGDYTESAYDWERHWQTLCKEPTEAFLDNHRSKA